MMFGIIIDFFCAQKGSPSTMNVVVLLLLVLVVIRFSKILLTFCQYATSRNETSHRY